MTVTSFLLTVLDYLQQVVIYIQPKWLLKQCFNVKLVEGWEINLDSSKDSVMNNSFVVPLA